MMKCCFYIFVLIYKKHAEFSCWSYSVIGIYLLMMHFIFFLSISIQTGAFHSYASSSRNKQTASDHRPQKRESHVLIVCSSSPCVWVERGSLPLQSMRGGRIAVLTSVPGAAWIHRVPSPPSPPAWSRVLLQFCRCAVPVNPSYCFLSSPPKSKDSAGRLWGPGLFWDNGEGNREEEGGLPRDEQGWGEESRDADGGKVQFCRTCW